MSTNLFVYGTLRTTFFNPPATHLRQHSRYVGEGVIAGRLYDVGSYPGALYIPDEPALIYGSVYELHVDSMAEVLAMLDTYEGIQATPPTNESDEYIRCVVPVRYCDVTVDCWVYLYNWPVDALCRIESGDYVRYINEQAGL